MPTTEERLTSLETAVNQLQAEVLRRVTSAALNAVEDARTVVAADLTADITTINSDLQKIKSQFSILNQKILSGFALEDVTLVSDAATITTTTFLMLMLRVETESLAASDNLATLNGGAEGNVVILMAKHDDRTVVVKNGTGNLHLAGSDFSLDHTKDKLAVAKVGSAWYELTRASNG